MIDSRTLLYHARMRARFMREAREFKYPDSRAVAVQNARLLNRWIVRALQRERARELRL